MSAREGPRTVASVENIGRLLDLFTVESPEVGVSQAARALGMSKSSAHALLTTLARIGLLHRFVTGRYRLGFRVMALNAVLMSHTPWRAVAREEMTHLAEATGEAVHLAALDGGQAICIDGVEGSAGAARLRVGAALPPHATALGKVILAHRPPAEIERAFASGPLRAYTPNTLTGRDDLLADLARIRERGYALDIEERVPGVCGVAAPIRDPNGEVIAAMSVSGPTRRFGRTRARLVEELRLATDAASRRGGYDASLGGEGGLYWHLVDGEATLRRAPPRREEQT